MIANPCQTLLQLTVLSVSLVSGLIANFYILLSTLYQEGFFCGCNSLKSHAEYGLGIPLVKVCHYVVVAY